MIIKGVAGDLESCPDYEIVYCHRLALFDSTPKGEAGPGGFIICA